MISIKKLLLCENDDIESHLSNSILISLSDLVAHYESLFDAYDHCVYGNKWSKTSAPLQVVAIEGGKYQLIDGYHRLIEHLLIHGGNKPIRVIVGGLGSEEYSIAKGSKRWEGDESKRYGNLERMTDKKTLNAHAKKRKATLKSGQM
jgi:hypothetical protein